MITKIQANGYRCLRYIDQPLSSTHVLIGPNASGKTTFLDTLGFLGTMLSDGVEAACTERSEASDFRDLTWNRDGTSFELVVEAAFPESIKPLLSEPYDTIRYEIRIGTEDGSGEPGILEEKGWLLETRPRKTGSSVRDVFPMELFPPETLFLPPKKKGNRLRIFSKVPKGNDNYAIETRTKGKRSGAGAGWFPSIKLGPRKSALANIPDDEQKFPVSTWFRNLLADGVSRFSLNSAQLRKPSPFSKSGGFRPDGSNLPWVVNVLEQPENRDRYGWWIDHVRTALPELEGVETRVRPEDRSRYLVIRYRGGLEVPSWVASDGTLRLLALTLLAYVPGFSKLCLIEEPENGIHPKAVETIFQALSGVYDAQILLATHSPIILGMAKPETILCFRKSEQGATDIVRGDLHPALKNWRGAVNLGELYAGGVL